MAYQHPSLIRNMFPVTLQPITNAMMLAKEPDPRKRDMRPILALCGKLPEADLDIMADMQTRKNSLTGFESRIEAQIPGGETSAPDIEIQRAAEMSARFSESGLHRTVPILFNGLFIGDGLIDLIWGINSRGQNAVVSWEPIEAIELMYLPETPTGLARLVYPSYSSSEAQIVPYDSPMQYLHAKYNPLEGIDNSYRGGLFRSMLWYVFLYIGNWYTWARAGERTGLLTHPRNYADVKSIDTVYEWLKTVVDNAVEMPDDLKVTIMELLNNKPDVKMYENFIDKITSKTSRIILGQDIVNESKKFGSRALAETAQETTRDYNWSDIVWLQNVYTDQYVRYDYTLNYGFPTTGLFPQMRFITDTIEDYKTNAVVISQAASAGWNAVDAEEVSRKLGLKVERAPQKATPPLPI